MQSSKFFCLKLKISENASPNFLFFTGRLYKCIRAVLSYFSDLH